MNTYSDLDDYERKVLESWEEIYKRGLLTMWLLLAVRDEPRYAAEIAEFVSTHSKGTMTSDDRSLYRSLRRLTRLELVQNTERRGGRTGADRKYYHLTPTGKNVLNAFLDRNIRGVYLDNSAQLFSRKD